MTRRRSFQQIINGIYSLNTKWLSICCSLLQLICLLRVTHISRIFHFYKEIKRFPFSKLWNNYIVSLGRISLKLIAQHQFTCVKHTYLHWSQRVFEINLKNNEDICIYLPDFSFPRLICTEKNFIDTSTQQLYANQPKWMQWKRPVQKSISKQPNANGSV